jgi:hypothetical protein
MNIVPRTRAGGTVELPGGVWCDWRSEFNAGPWAEVRPREIRINQNNLLILFLI